jgi:hypothetical protein
MESCVGTLFFAVNIYEVVSPRGNEWETYYLLEHCLEGRHTLMQSITNSTRIEFPIGLMVINKEYMKHDGRTRKKGGYVFQDYR